jgi:hypothetical protein
MAIDTRDRRASVVDLDATTVPIFPNPDGTLAARADRAFMARTYAGGGFAAALAAGVGSVAAAGVAAALRHDFRLTPTTA